MLTFLALITLIASAHFAGWLICRYSREELKVGRDYFLIALRALFCVVVALFCYSVGLSWWLAAPLIALTLALMLWKKSSEMFERRPAYAQVSLGVMAGAILVGENAFPLAASLFVAALLQGSLDSAVAFQHKKSPLKPVSLHATVFAFIAMLFGFVLLF
ncbi:MAG: hypothetical protein V1735_05595 [Nanoarchaeota archaeon]